ncbi:MAG: ABC transporter ATP-binding protein [Microcoleaceae cyanobacterium]
MTPAVQLVDLCKSFTSHRGKSTLAVDSLNLTVAPGEFFSLLGPSGCGKTTTLRMISGFESPSSGEIYVHNRSVRQDPPFHRPVNTVFQNYALFPHLTVAENVAFGLEMDNQSRTQIRQRVTDILGLVQLTDLQNRYPRQLSGGQQQRVALARALVKQPQVLLLDEPLGALDLKLRREMQLELKRMQQQLGITFIYVTHDQEEALTMSDRIGVMHQGILLQVGTPAEIYESPQSQFVANFIGESNVLPGVVQECQGDQLSILIHQRFPVTLPVSSNLLGIHFSPGQLIHLAIRPERLRICPPDRVSGWPGQIQEVIYLGTDCRYIVQLDENFSVVARRQNLHPQEFQTYQSGNKVVLEFSPESFQILRD